MSITTMREAAYAPDTKDATWIPEVAARGWVILTKDKTIRRDSLELGAVLAARAFYFTLGGQNYLAAEMVAIILHHRTTMERLVMHRDPPVVAQLNRHEVLLRGDDGKLRMIKRKP
jgi:PIN like domain